VSLYQPQFLACLPKDIEPRLEAERVDRAHRIILSKLSVDAGVVTSGSWFKKTFIQSGNYAGWIYDCVHGRNSMTASPHVAAGRAVILIDDEELQTITGVQRNDNESWALGWTVHTKETAQ
jgi:hypothetical protein